MERLPRNVQKLWWLSGGFSGLVLGGIVAAGLVALVITDSIGSWGFGLAALVALGATAVGVWWSTVNYRNWGWRIDDRWVEAKHGVLGRHRVVIPRNRIQTVTTNSGPIDRMLDLETITVHTAGGGAPNLTIPHLTTETVMRIREELGQGVER